MNIRAFYNEIEPFACAWLSNLMDAGLITPGVICDRSIADLAPSDVVGFSRCHFFAGIGGWDYALNLAGWGDREIWTGSCPCQPFSAAGKGGGFEDSRHLWPTWFRLIRECRPPVVFGEQVASAAGLAWFDHVSTDLEAEGYAIGAADLCAAGVGAPHIRQRLFFVAHGDDTRCGAWRPGQAGDGRDSAWVEPSGLRIAGSLAHAGSYGLYQQCGIIGEQEKARERWNQSNDDGPRFERRQGGGVRRPGAERSCAHRGGQVRSAPSLNPWSDLLWLPCRDGKARPTQPGIQPLAHGVPNRVGTLRGAGNAIVPACAAAFIESYLARKA